MFSSYRVMGASPSPPSTLSTLIPALETPEVPQYPPRKEELAHQEAYKIFKLWSSPISLVSKQDRHSHTCTGLPGFWASKPTPFFHLNLGYSITVKMATAWKCGLSHLIIKETIWAHLQQKFSKSQTVHRWEVGSHPALEASKQRLGDHFVRQNWRKLKCWLEGQVLSNHGVL